ncbi:Bacterial extracellular solute-binding proteins, family 3 [Roseibium album]|nr:Bacterial extracellular solute-binding proteins, family 3 [Roseibium album]
MNTRSFLFIVASLSLGAMTPNTSLANTDCRRLNVAAAEIPYFVESEDKGVFVNLIRTAARRAGLELTIKVYPKKRALKLFQHGRVNALLPHSSAGTDLPSYKSTPILIKRDFVFVRRGTPIPKTISELEGLQIGLTKQYAYSNLLTSNKNIEFSRAPHSDLANIKMLSFGRLDGSIIEERSGLKAISDAGVGNIVYDRQHPINEFLVWVLFSKDKCGKQLSNKMNSEFSAMKSDGKWEEVMTPPNSDN